VDRSTITRAIGEVRPLLVERGCTVSGFDHESWFWLRFRAAVTERCASGGSCLAGQG
jgi:hypothetical protein